MSRDIVNNEDIKELVDAFYHQLLEDELLGYIFRDYMELSLQQHLPIMYSFWESVLLGQMSYKGNPILKHIELNKQVNLNEAHFNHWVGMWEQTVDSLFNGDIALQAKRKANTMKELMLFKIKQSSNDNFIM